MSQKAKREYVFHKSTQYRRCVNRAQKRALIEEVASTCGFSQKYVIKRLNSPLPLTKTSTPRKRTYSEEDVFWLKQIWSECDFACGKLLVGLVNTVLESFEKEGIGVPEPVAGKLRKMSAATIDRLLHPYKFERPRKRSGSVLNTLYKEIPMSALRSSQCTQPGHLGLDSVALCGGHMNGAFFWILTLTDVFSGYTLIAPVWNKTSDHVADALMKMLNALPFSPKEIHPDNGSEFLNSKVFRRIKSEFPNCSITRSRPYRKNDNAHVEQKNGAVVRRLFGEIRFDDIRKQSVLEQICELANLRSNHFFVSRKLQSKTRNVLTGFTAKQYDSAKSPVERLLSSDLLSEADKTQLLCRAQNTHLLKINRELSRLLKLAAADSVELAQQNLPTPSIRYTF